MTGLPTDLILEGLVAVLLLATVFYCAMLDRRLKALRSGQDGLRHLIDDLHAATEQARAGIGDLKEASEVIGRDLNDKLTQGQSLAEELKLMIDAGDRIADRLSQAATRPAMPPIGRGIEGPLAHELATPDPFEAGEPDPEDDKPRTVKQAENRLLKALRSAR